MTFVEKLAAYLASTSGMTMEEVASLVKKEDGSVNTDALEVFDKATTGYQAKIHQVKKEAGADSGKKFDEGYSKAKREIAEAIEEKIRATFKIEEQLKGDDLLKAVENLGKSGGAGKKAGELTQDEVEKSPFFIRAVNKAKEEAEARATEKETELNNYKAEVAKTETMRTVWDKASPIIDGLKLNLSEDATKKANQIKILKRELESYGYQLDPQTGSISVLKDGKLHKDPNENPVAFDALVKDIALQYFDPVKGERRSSVTPPAGGGAGDKKGTWNRPMPKSSDEYFKLANDRSIPLEERQALSAAWDAAQEATTA